MQHRLLSEGASTTHVLAFEDGDEFVDGLTRFARENDVASGHFVGLGAFSEARLAFFNLETREYDEIPVDEQVEVLNVTGNLTRFDGEPRLHVHATLSRPDGSTVGGHLLSGIVRPTLEVFVTVFQPPVERTVDERTGLPLINL